ncbi:Octicosapeptide/phox/Bem1p family protein [Quillaja saponaria]|uniref:Octicosapeptide/phox/Bem1p family protein n=1 Tax=Quillaja saponaria TaxID=32244 RepID=A0AAD7KNG7_QUISA|nr:Octicosapeptide/phox/Bem1p family protein [Quillaja saponaria]
MEAPPPPQPPPAAPPLIATVAPLTHLSYPDPVDSSPRSRNNDSWEEPFPATGVTSRLRLMCSYGGHIVPRPHDKSLCYVGGDTRIFVVDRHTSLSDLSSRLSKTFLNDRPFTLKYQLPSEDLDSLISVTTDEDLDNMIDEYDRTAANSSNPSVRPSRIRLFLFPAKPDSSQSIGPLLDNSTKSEDWFLNALNATGMLNRGFSESASVNCLLGLDDDVVGNNIDSVSRDSEAAQTGSFGNGKNVKQGQDVHSVPDSPMLETNSSFGSTSSSPSLTNFPPIRVHVDDGSGGGVKMQDQKVGIEEQFAQLGVSSGQKQDEGFVVLSSPPPIPATISAASTVQMTSAVVTGEYQNRVFSDDERSDHGVPVGYRKQPLSQPQSQPQFLPPQSQQKSSAVVDLPSPDSVSSDSSLTNAISRQKPVIYQDPGQIPSGTTRMPSNPVDPNLKMSDPNSRVHMQQQLQDSGYVLQSQFDQQPQQQQQFVHGTHYIHHHPAGAMPVPTYYPVYPSQQQPQHHHHPQLDQQYQVYYMPARQPQAYNLSVQQPNVSEAATGIPSSRPQAPPNPGMVQQSAAYNQMRTVPISKPEMTAGAYRTANAGTPQLVQVPSSQHQQQYLNYSQIHHPSQSIAPNSGTTANYVYEFEYADPSHAQIYYTQPLAPNMPSQYQTMTAAAAVGLPEVSGQHPTEKNSR